MSQTPQLFPHTSQMQRYSRCQCCSSNVYHDGSQTIVNALIVITVTQHYACIDKRVICEVHIEYMGNVDCLVDLHAVVRYW